MRIVGIFLTACVVLAAAQAVAVTLAFLLTITLIYGLFAYPRETFGLLGLGVLSGLIQQQPLACLSVLALLTAISALRRR